MDLEHSASRTEGRVTLGSIASALSDAYPAFAQVLAEHAVTKEEFAGTAEWIERAGFERTLLSILGEAERAGNIILVVDNIAALIDEGARIGADVMNVLY